MFIEKDFSEVLIKARTAKGNILTKFNVQRIGLKSHGHSTLGGRKVWFDPDVNRLNYDEHGTFLGEFNEDDSILVVLNNGDFYITNFDANNHYEDNIMIIEKWNPNKVWSLALIDADNNNFYYVKRFCMEATKKHQNFVGENAKNQMLILTDQAYPRLLVTFGGADAYREPLEIDVESFIGVKGFKAKGKRISTWNIHKIEQLEPLRTEENTPLSGNEADNTIEETSEEENLDPDKGKSSQQVRDELTGQLSITFDVEDNES